MPEPNSDHHSQMLSASSPRGSGSSSRRETSMTTLIERLSIDDHRLSPPKVTIEDSATKGESETLTAYTADQNDINLPDLLPSFEMYQNLHGNIPSSDFDEYLPENPPFYEDISSSRCSSLDFAREPNVEMIQGSSTNSDLESGTRSVQSSNSDRQTLHRDRTSTHQTRDFPVEKLYSLPKGRASISIEIYVTKKVPKFGQKPEYESMLKEYTSGDQVHGYCIVENLSSKPIKYDMFYLTLEGTMITTEKSNFKIKRSTKRFLRMVDLAASWSYFSEDVNTGENLCGIRDAVDNSRFGLHRDRVLKPGVRCKKFFNFKVPNQLLDTTCKHGHFSHSLLPPSLGFEKPNPSNTEACNLEIDEGLGYGRLPERGSSIVTMDGAGDSSICYSIDARIVGNDVRTESPCILAENKFCLRIIPFGFDYKPISKSESLAELKILDLNTAKKLEKVEKIFSKVEHRQSITESDISETEEIGQPVSSQRKHSWDPTKSENIKAEALLSKYSPQGDYAESELSYSIKSILGVGLKTSFFKGFSNSKPSQSITKSDKNGLIMVKAEIPRGSLPTWSPLLIRRQNEYSLKNKNDQTNWLKLLDLLAAEEKEKVQHLKFELLCVQAANGEPHEPPGIESITTQLVVVTEKSDNCLPIMLHTDTLLNDYKYNNIKKKFREYSDTIKTYNTIFDEKQAEINSLYVGNNQLTNCNPKVFTDLISAKEISDIQSLANMEVDVTYWKTAFKSKVNASSEPSSSPSLLSVVSRGSKKSTSSTSGASTITHRKSLEWEAISPTEYAATVNLDLKFNENFKRTLPPSFKGCLSSRSYLVRVKVNFKGGAGSTTVDVPVQIKNLHTM